MGRAGDDGSYDPGVGRCVVLLLAKPCVLCLSFLSLQLLFEHALSSVCTEDLKNPTGLHCRHRLGTLARPESRGGSVRHALIWD